MLKPHKHPKEHERLKLLESYAIIDTLPESDYDDLTSLAAETCHTPISLVTIVDHNRQWFKSHHGLNVTETPREYAFCAHTINHPDKFFMVSDARKDERFHDNPLVTGDPKVVFYAGVPLLGPGQLPLGTLCVIDNEPRTLNQSQVNALKALSKQVMNLLELRKAKARLEKALEEQEKVNAEMERFAFIAAHDLKSPLHNISSLASLFLTKYGTEINEEGVKYIERISGSADKLKTLIDGLLEYSKTGNILRGQKSEINLQELKSTIKNLLDFNNTCSINLNTTLDRIFTNRIAIEQILLNLVSNSIKYNNKPKTLVDIEITEDELHYHISVKDNGPGILPEHHERAFGIFEILTVEDRFGHRGNGIGLATVKKLVEALGGEIHIEPESKTGTNFVFTLEKP